jgi:predicted nucleic acid-binding Zn ribbon protein
MSELFAAKAALGVVATTSDERTRRRRACSGAGLATMERRLTLKSAAAVGGAWSARNEDMPERRFAKVTERAKAAISPAADIRETAK